MAYSCAAVGPLGLAAVDTFIGAPSDSAMFRPSREPLENVRSAKGREVAGALGSCVRTITERVPTCTSENASGSWSTAPLVGPPATFGADAECSLSGDRLARASWFALVGDVWKPL